MTSSILIIGGGGSLGREFVRYLYPLTYLSYRTPSDERNFLKAYVEKTHEVPTYKITVVENNEWAVAELRSEFPDIEIIMDDFASDHYLKAYNYCIVLAAYKHINLAEENIKSCIENNLTKLAKFYDESIVNHLLYLSTDKAVEPISVYGATKMIAERLTWSLGGSVARCGNFLMSSGSVIPVWEKAILEGKKIPITDEKMVRYVSDMTEAVPEIWERFLSGEKLIVPKVREIRLMDLLAEVLKKHKYMNPEAYTPGVEIIGMRPGEKLQEKLKWENE